MTAPRAPRTLLRSAGPLVPALGLAGVLGYAVYAGAGRLLTPAEFAVFAGFWGLLFGIGGVLGGAEQESARAASALRARGLPGQAAARPMLRAVAVVATLLLLIAVPVGTWSVLDGDLRLGALVALAGVGFAAQSVVRGVLLGAGRTSAYAGLLVAEAAVRAAVLTVLVLIGTPGLLACAAAVVPGSFVFLLVGRAAGTGPRPTAAAPVAPAPQALRRTAGLALGALATSAVVTGFPALATAFATEGTDRAALGALLAAVTLTRLPLLLLGPVQAVLVPALVHRLAVSGWTGARRLLRRVLLAVAGGTLVLAGGALLVGPAVVRLVYGSDYVTGGPALGAMTVGAGLVAGLVVLAAGLVALERHALVPLVWGACLAALVAVLVLPPLPHLDRVVLSLVAGPAVGVLVGAVGLSRAAGSVRARRGSAPGPAASGNAPDAADAQGGTT